MAGKSRSINIFLLDGEPDGVRTAQIDLSTIHAIAFKRAQLVRVRLEFKDDLSRPGVYLLLGEDADGKRIAYVGESEDVAARLKTHSADPAREFWIDTIAFVSKDENLTKSHARYAEALLIKAARVSGGWSLPNGQNPTEVGKLPKPGESTMTEFVDQAKTLTSALGFDLFKVTTGKLAASVSAACVAATLDSPEFRYAGTGNSFDARVVVSGASGEWVVKAGSTARLVPAGAIPAGAQKRRDALLASGVLNATQTHLIFTTDYAFDSSSMAAAVVSGQSVSGPKAWAINGTTYADWEAGLAGGVVAPEPEPDLLTESNGNITL